MLKEFANEILLEQLIYLLHNASEEDIIDLIKFKNELKDGKIAIRDRKKEALLELIDDIIDKNSDKIKSIVLDDEQNSDSTDIKIEY